jgi:hypothetical protein
VHEPTTQAAQWDEGVINTTPVGTCSTSNGSVPPQFCKGTSAGAGGYVHVRCPNDCLANFLAPLFAMTLPGWAFKRCCGGRRSVFNDNYRYARRILQAAFKFCFVADGSKIVENVKLALIFGA